MSYVELQKWRDRQIERLNEVLNAAGLGYYKGMLNAVIDYALDRYRFRPRIETDEEAKEALKIEVEINDRQKEIFSKIEVILKSRERGKSIHLS